MRVVTNLGTPVSVGRWIFKAYLDRGDHTSDDPRNMVIAEVQLSELGPMFGNSSEFDILNLAYKNAIETPRFMNAFREIRRRVKPETISVPQELGHVFCANMAFKNRVKRMGKPLHYSDGTSRKCILFSTGEKCDRLCKSCHRAHMRPH